MTPAILLVVLGAIITSLPILEPVMEPEVEFLSRAYTQEQADKAAIETFKRIEEAAKDRGYAGVEQAAAQAIAKHRAALRLPG